MATYTGSEAITVTLVANQVDTITLTGAGTELRISQTSTTPIYIITAQPGQTPATPTVAGAGTTAIMTNYPVVLPWTGSGIVIKVISAGTGTVNFTLTTSKFAPLGDLSLKADLISPTFTGIPAAPTATAGTSTTQLATTAFVTTADQLLGTYTAYTPTFPSGLSLGNGVVTSEYCRVNDFVHYWGRVVLGTTSSMSNFGLQVSMPVSHDSSFSSTTGMFTGFANFRDVSAGTPYIGLIRPIEGSPTTASIICQNIVSTYLAGAAVQTAVPFTWTSTDIIMWSMFYQAA